MLSYMHRWPESLQIQVSTLAEASIQQRAWRLALKMGGDYPEELMRVLLWQATGSNGSGHQQDALLLKLL